MTRNEITESVDKFLDGIYEWYLRERSRHYAEVYYWRDGILHKFRNNPIQMRNAIEKYLDRRLPHEGEGENKRWSIMDSCGNIVERDSSGAVLELMNLEKDAIDARYPHVVSHLHKGTDYEDSVKKTLRNKRQEIFNEIVSLNERLGDKMRLIVRDNGMMLVCRADKNIARAFGRDDFRKIKSE